MLVHQVLRLNTALHTMLVAEMQRYGNVVAAAKPPLRCRCEAHCTVCHQLSLTGEIR